MKVLVYKSYINMKKRVLRVPNLSLVTDIPVDLDFENTFDFAREKMSEILKSDYLSKDMDPPLRDSAQERKQPGEIETYIDLDIEMMISDKKTLEEMSEIEKDRVYNLMSVKENVIEWIGSEKVLSFTLCQQKYINKIRKIAAQNPNNAKIIIENEDGSIYGKLNRSCLRLQNPPEYTEEQKRISSERLQNARMKKNTESE